MKTTGAGGFTVHGDPVTNGSLHTAMRGDDGTLVASYVDDPVTVTLGEVGGTIMLVLQDDQKTWHKDGEVFTSGDQVMVMIDNRTNTYTVTMDMETGMWSAEYQPFNTNPIALGASEESVMLIRDEMGGWWVEIDAVKEAFGTGDTYMAASGNVYQLTYGEGAWSAMYQPVTMMIMGTDLTASANEDGTGYTIVGLADQTLDDKGMGDVMTEDANYRVHMDEDGNLVGTQYEMAVNGNNDGEAGHWVDTGFGDNRVVVIGDDAETTPNEAGTMITIDGETHSIGDLFMDGESTVEGDNIVAGVLTEVSAQADQIKGLIAVNVQEGEDLADQTNFADQFRARWKAIDTALDTVFGDGDDLETDADYEHIDALPGNAGERLSAAAMEAMVEMLDAIVAALSDGDAFAAAAAEDGIFEDGFTGDATMRATASGKAFNAIDSTATAYMVRTENTRFGVYSKQTTDTADVALGSDSMGAYAYSSMNAAQYADLPQSGGASYDGRTMAVSVDGKTIYNGDISLEVRFRAKRVSGLVKNLLDGDGNLFEYGFGEVAAIILPEAAIMTDGSFMQDPDRTGQIVFTAEPGSPQAILLEDPPVTVVGDVEVVIPGSYFAGQFVGDGAAAIGTWGINASTDGSENLAAAFGAEKGDDVPERALTVTGGGVSRTSLTGDGISAVDDDGVITLGPALTVNGADLFLSGGLTINGEGFVASAIEEIQSQLERLNAFIALDELGSESIADTGRSTVWTALATTIEMVVGANNGDEVFVATDYVTTNADDTDADAAAKEIIADVLAALSSKTNFRTAVAEDGALYGDSGLITGDDAAIDAVFDRVTSTATVEYGSTQYTRFGAWNRVSTDNATTAPTLPGDNPNGVFAYSPLRATAYSVNDPNFPAGASATYEGTTIARGNDADNTYYEGSITIGVTWLASLGTAGQDADVGSITASITNLRDSSGALYMVDGNGVETILFTSDTINVSRAGEDNTLSFNAPGTSVRLRHAEIRQTDVESTDGASIDGMFVGKIIDGPQGIIGSWGLANIPDGDDLEGAYGADLPL